MLDLHTSEEGGYTEVNPPFLVRDNAAYGVGQLPRFAEDMFKAIDPFHANEALEKVLAEASGGGSTRESLTRYASELAKAESQHRWWLIPTAEVPLTNLVNDTVLEEKQLPLRFTAWTPCFRSEAGAAGKDTRGMIRQHQFPKVELVSITTPEQSGEEHKRMTSRAEEVLKRLPRARPSTSRSGCPARTPIARFRAARTAASTRPGAWARASARRRAPMEEGGERASCTP